MTVSTERGTTIRVPQWLLSAVLVAICSVTWYFVREIHAQSLDNTSRISVMETQLVEQEKVRAAELKAMNDKLQDIKDMLILHEQQTQTALPRRHG
jgi:hypothetical protein